MTFKLPTELEDLIADGHWPTEGRHVKSQNSEAIIPRELVRQVFPDESLFCFCLPPFPALSEIQGEEVWRSETARPDQLNHSTALVLGDFELGSDSAVILDYEADALDPPVKWLRYEGYSHTYWDTACKNFRELSDRLKLRNLTF